MANVMPTALSRERAEQAHTLRALGFSWNEIANQLGYRSHGAAQTAVKRHRQRNPPPTADEAMSDIIERRRVAVRALTRSLARAQAAGDASAVASLSRAITAADAETSKLLGLYAPDRVDVTVGRSAAELRAATRDATLAALEARQAASGGIPVAVHTAEPEPLDVEVEP